MRAHRTSTTTRKLARTAVVASALLGLSTNAFAGLPAHTTKVPVTAGNTKSGIDAQLTVGASISGKVTAAKGGAPVYGAFVWVYSGQTVVNSRSTDSSGNYTVGALPAGTFSVCVSASFLSSGSTTGYLARCYQTAAWTQGGKVPTSAKHVTVSLGQQKTGINVSLPSAAAISGKVTTKGGKAISGVAVWLRNRNTGAIAQGATTTTNGTYTATGLVAPSKGYSVCFNPQFATVTSGTGFRPRCFHNTAWNGATTKFPGSARAVKTALGKTHTKVNQALTAGGAITGVVTDAKTKKALSGVFVVAYSPARTFLAFAQTNNKGHYTLRGLAPATKDHVCGGPSTDSTKHVLNTGRCWKTASYKGAAPPKSANPVSVKVGKVHKGINLKLGHVALGSIAGKVTEAAGGQPLTFATVTAYGSNGSIGSSFTQSDGTYNIQNLQPLASPGGYRICVSPPSFSSSPPEPATGWAPRCFNDVAWSGTAPAPTGATKLSLKAGQKRSGVNVAVHVGGAISGTLTQAGGSTPAQSVFVFVYTPAGGEVGFATSQSDGTYSVNGLTPGNYVVCFDGRSIFEFPQGYRPECYNNQAWNGSA